MEQREELVRLMEAGLVPVTDLCALYGVSRKTAYKWAARARSGAGLADQSRAPRTHPNALAAGWTEQILQLKAKHPLMGPKKLRALMLASVPRDSLVPAASTVGGVLQRHGLVKRQPPRQARQPRGATELREVAKPNDTWCIDFKGEFRLGNGQLCYPLTVTDAFSRYLLAIEAFPGTRYDLTRRACEKLFDHRGLPAVIRADGGVPFFGRGAGCVSRLSVWWMKLGIYCERVSRPQQNGRHERMHRTLKEHATRPPSASIASQQQRFDLFRAHFNEVRPHEALEMKPPAELYAPSPRRDLRETTPEYPRHFEVREVSRSGTVVWRGRTVFVSEALAKEPVGIEEIDDGLHRATYGTHLLGFLSQKRPEFGLIHPHSRRLENLVPMSPVQM